MSAETAMEPMDSPDFDALDGILDALRQQDPEVPQWEFCEGAMAALLCTRRPVETEESLPLIVGLGEGEGGVSFDDASQAAQFHALWARRWREIETALQADVQTLEDERAYQPEVLDVRGAVAMLPPEEQADMQGMPMPSFAQIWALGFMFVVENWPEEWQAPRDRETAGWIDDALDTIVALTEEDTGKPAFNMHAEEGPPSVSEERANAFGEAIWAVYDLYRIWNSLGPRVEPVRKDAAPGRNDPCPCGSGKKYKKCCGAGA